MNHVCRSIHEVPSEDDYIHALDVLEHATKHLAEQFDFSWPRDIAQAHMNARAILLRTRMNLCDEAERVHCA